jgi:transposase
MQINRTRPLAPEIRETLIEAHRAERVKRQADRIKTILLLDDGRSYEEVAHILFLDDSTIRRYEGEYHHDGLDALLEDHYKGGASSLSVTQEEELRAHLRTHLYHRAKDIVKHIKETYRVTYTPEGLVHLLHRLHFSYKKSKQVPGKTDPEKQVAFLEEYKKIKECMDETDELYFTDGSHPQHNSLPAYAWIETGHEKEVKTNTGRQRVNLNGALSAKDHSAVVLAAETINVEAMIELFKALEALHPLSKTIHLIMDNARYNHARIVREYITTSRIQIHYLPPYAPNLNLIERLWKFFHKKVTYNTYYDTYEKFKTACLTFFTDMGQYQDKLDSLLVENFHIIGARVS